MGGPGFYGPMGSTGDEVQNSTDPRSLDPLGSVKVEEEYKKDGKEGDDKKEKQGPTREAFMDPTFGGFYDDLAAGPPVDNLPPGERPYEKGNY